jgi:hypothetical protein
VNGNLTINTNNTHSAGSSANTITLAGNWTFGTGAVFTATAVPCACWLPHSPNVKS